MPVLVFGKRFHCQNSVRPETIDFSLSSGQASEMMGNCCKLLILLVELTTIELVTS